MPRNVVSGMLRDGLYTRVVGRQITYFQCISSTMDEAVRQAEEGVDEGAVILARTRRQDGVAFSGRGTPGW